MKIMESSELAYIEKLMDNIFQTRNNLLTFSFTIVVAALGIGFTKYADNNPIIYLLPFFIIVPFTGRITYYRIWEAYLEVCLEEHGEHLRQKNFNKYVQIERANKVDGIMAVLVNYEMFILAAACLVLCVLKYPIGLDEFLIGDYIYFAVAIFSVALVFIIITAAFSFSKVKDAYRKKWINRNPII